jgi:tetratricopeptide (TPR) repeat protein
MMRIRNVVLARVLTVVLTRVLAGVLISVLTAVLAAVLTTRAAHAAEPEAAQRENEYGITLALSGRLAAAESAFVSSLSRAPRDPRPLANLGNVALLRGDADLALAFYDRALAAGEDAGVRLDRAAALLVRGDTEAARREAALAIRRAGGPEAAARLVGVSLGDSTVPRERGAESKSLTHAEVADLLRHALEAVPADTTQAVPVLAPRVTPPDSSRAATPRTTRRSAGLRSEGEGETAMVLYWKRE